MKAAVVIENRLTIKEVDKPSVGSQQVLVKVRACGMNRADLKVASGQSYGRVGGDGTIVGLEFAGEVVSVGKEVKSIKSGDRVMCTGVGGGWAEYAVADWGRVIILPDNNMSWSKAASLPVALQTMHDAVITNGRLIEGETILIQGASSGVGLMAMQIAKAKGAKKIIGTSTDPTRRNQLTDYGADLALDSRDNDWVQEVLEATDGKGVDLIIDQISGYVANQNMEATAVSGRIVNVGRLGGFTGEFNFDLHAMRRIDYIGVTFRTRSIQEARKVVQAMKDDLWEAVELGKLSLPIDKEFQIGDAPEAVEYMRANKHFGKIIILVDI
tara:strand:- start:19566 stop:20546 length:981 start_codon:yes stop_codon:yes gene_type:complete